MDERYSVLMSVYQKEKPAYLQAALRSMLEQTWPPDEIVLVCDGPLTEALDQVIEGYLPQLVVVRLPENRGLGHALAEGLKHCKNELIARMDTDDLSVRERCAWQIAYLREHPEVDVLSGTLAEFKGDHLDVEAAKEHILSYKKVPAADQDIRSYIRYRNPVNHPCVMFKKTSVLAVGGYQPCHLFEDYDLWARMYLAHYTFANLTETLLYMRVDEMHKRRGGLRYGGAVLSFQTKLYRYGVIGLPQYLAATSARILVSLLPDKVRKIVYSMSLRTIR